VLCSINDEVSLVLVRMHCGQYRPKISMIRNKDEVSLCTSSC
jgi:hypothetical protein